MTMTYQETVTYLFNSYPVFEHVGGSAYKEGLYNSHALDEHFGHPHRSYKTIHVAGTNGKGSCSHTLAAVLQSAGYRVGLYTSPHLVDFRERIKVNGTPISEQRVIDFVESERENFEPLHPSFFELTTAMAFLYFKEQQVDVAVIEVGLGGRLDCTNIITPILSVITNISFDHTQFLGNTLAKIAYEKAGIIKEGIPVVVGETTEETRPVFVQTARERHAPLVMAEDCREVSGASASAYGGRDYQTKGYGILHGALGGDYQDKNANTILAAIDVLRGETDRHKAPSHERRDATTLGLNNGMTTAQGSVDDANHSPAPLLRIMPEHVREGFERVCELTGLTGRWQTLRKRPLVICDTGHNVGGWNYLSRQIKHRSCTHLRMVFGMVDDKDVDGVMCLLPENAIYYWTQARSKRALPASVIAEKGMRHRLQGQVFGSVADAYHAAIHDAQPDDFIFIGGSSYIVADLLALNDF